jgi:hypothetical protein
MDNAEIWSACPPRAVLGRVHGVVHHFSSSPPSAVVLPRSAFFAQPAFLEHLQHRGVLRQDLRDQLLEPGCVGNRREMAYEGRADPLPLALVDHGEGHLGLAGLRHDVASAAGRSPAICGGGLDRHRRDA